MVGPRTRIGRHDTLFFRERVYELEDALEVEEYTLTTIERRRVPFEDVLAATHHLRRGPVYLLVTGLLAVACGIGTAALLMTGEAAGVRWGIVLGLLAALFLLLFSLRAVLGVDVITVQGRRTAARLSFVYRKALARETFDRLTRRIRERHEQLAAELPPPPPPPEVPLPPGP